MQYKNIFIILFILALIGVLFLNALGRCNDKGGDYVNFKCEIPVNYIEPSDGSVGKVRE